MHGGLRWWHGAHTPICMDATTMHDRGKLCIEAAAPAYIFAWHTRALPSLRSLRMPAHTPSSMSATL